MTVVTKMTYEPYEKGRHENSRINVKVLTNKTKENKQTKRLVSGFFQGGFEDWSVQKAKPNKKSQQLL